MQLAHVIYFWDTLDKFLWKKQQRNDFYIQIEASLWCKNLTVFLKIKGGIFSKQVKANSEYKSKAMYLSFPENRLKKYHSERK